MHWFRIHGCWSWVFHDVTVVDMGDLPESSVSMDDLSLLRRQWPPTVLWCGYSRIWILCVRWPRNFSVIPGRGIVPTVTNGLNATCIAMWCPGAWCGRARHRIAWIMSGGRMMYHGTLNLPVWRSLFPRGRFSVKFGRIHSGISTDVLLFSDINLSLALHYRVHKRGLPHIAFQKDYLTCLRVFVSQAAARSRRDMVSPVQSGPVSMRHAHSTELNSELPWKTRRALRRMRPVRILEESVGVEPPTLTVQDASDLQGAIVYDCRPPILPVSLRLEDIGPLPLHRTVVSASLAAPPLEDFMAIGGASPEGVAIPELGVAPLVDPDTDLEDELPTLRALC